MPEITLSSGFDNSVSLSPFSADRVSAATLPVDSMLDESASEPSDLVVTDAEVALAPNSTWHEPIVEVELPVERSPEPSSSKFKPLVLLKSRPSGDAPPE